MDQGCQSKRLRLDEGELAKRHQLLELDVGGLQKKLSKPLRPLWVTPEALPNLVPSSSDSYYPVVCCTASRRIRGFEGSEDGYIQGAADDSESWAHGITPQLFWEHQDMLMSTREEDLPTLVHRLNIETPAAVGHVATLIRRTQNMFVGPLGALDTATFDGIIFCADQQDVQAMEVHPGTSRKTLHLACGSGKLGSRALRSQLQRVPPFIARFDTTDRAPSLLFVCPSGKDLSAGVALAVLCLYYDDSGKSATCILSVPSSGPILPQRSQAI